MTFSFTSTIPAANDDPADDQPLMLQNNASTSGLIAVDHTGFNVADGGTHKQVTFGSNNVPSLPTSFPILFSNNKDGAGNNLPAGVAELLMYSGSAAQSSSQYVAAANGSTMALCGIIIKWGTGATGPNSFTSAFPNNCFGVFIQNNQTLYTGSFIASGVTVSGFTATRTSGSGSTGFYYFAIGN